MGTQEFYEEGEAEEILRRAMKTDTTGAVDRNRLLSMASDLGISEESIVRAESQMEAERQESLSKQQDAALRADFKTYRKNRFFTDFSSYLSVNLLMVFIWWFTGRHYFWPGWLIGIWGIEVFGDMLNLFTWSDKDFERWKRKRERVRELEG